MIFGNEYEFVFFSFFSIESDLSPNLSSFRVDAEGLGLADVFVVHFEEVSEENVFFFLIRLFVVLHLLHVTGNKNSNEL